MTDEQRMIEIPAVQYLRPDGRRNLGSIVAPRSKEVEEKLELMKMLGIEITMEAMPFGQMVNVCFDDGDFDYKFELIPNDSELGGEVSRLVADFDVEDYHRVKEVLREEDMHE